MVSNVGILRNPTSVSDFLRLEEEFQARKRAAAQQEQMNAARMKQIEAELSKPDIEGLAQQSMYDFYQGKPLTEQGKAALSTLAAMEGSKTTYQPDEFGNVRAITAQNPYQQFLDQISGASTQETKAQDPLAASRAAIQQRNAEGIQNKYQTIPEAPFDLNKTDLERMAFTPENIPPTLDPFIAESPYGRKQIFDAQLKLMQDRNNPETDIGKMQLDEKRGLVPSGSTDALIAEKTRQTRKEEASLKEDEEKRKKADAEVEKTKNIVKTKISEAVKILFEHPTSAGGLATTTRMVPGKFMPVDVLGTTYSTLQSNTALDKMLQLKAASSTGSTGFGALNEKELQLLIDQIAALDPELPREVQLENLRQIANAFGVEIPELTGKSQNMPRGWSDEKERRYQELKAKMGQ